MHYFIGEMNIIPAKNPYSTLCVNRNSKLKIYLQPISGIKPEAKIDPARPRTASSNIFIGPN